MGKQFEQDGAKVLILIFGIVMIIAIGRTAGGWTSIIREVFSGIQGTAQVLVNAPSA